MWDKTYTFESLRVRQDAKNHTKPPRPFMSKKWGMKRDAIAKI